MADIVRIEVDKTLQEVLEDVRRTVAIDMKKKYDIDEISVPRTLSSRILAAKHRGEKTIKFRVRKVGSNKGFLDLL